MTVVRGNGSFHRLGLGSLDHCAVALAQIHCAFTSVLFARFTSTPPSHLFPSRRPWLRSDEMGRGVRSRPAHQGRIQHPTNAKGAEPVTTSTAAPWGLPERALFCHAILNRVRARRLSLPPRRFSLLPRSGRGHRFDHASVAVCRPLQDSTWIAWAAKSPNSVEVRTRPS